MFRNGRLLFSTEKKKKITDNRNVCMEIQSLYTAPLIR